ncbi:WecB/TagA/CpsF family glycosyltransferase [Streptodolium elevatio]|uniref:WecB/TagA/CpsF family glycosyltransferase n=1 Tax=Streptodolium elevatio TaxID=3157996 RepID=A0ABV3DXN0_9ACTN
MSRSSPPDFPRRSCSAACSPGQARAGAPGMRQVTGPDLMLDLLARAVERGWTSYFYGGAEGVPEMLANHLGLRFPGLKVVAPFVCSGRQRSWAPYPARHPGFGAIIRPRHPVTHALWPGGRGPVPWSIDPPGTRREPAAGTRASRRVRPEPPLARRGRLGRNSGAAC